MSDYEPKAGDRVRVTVEGTVSGEADGFKVQLGEMPLCHIAVRQPNGDIDPSPYSIEVEKIPDPEPEWRPGDVALGPNGIDLYERGGHGDWRVLRCTSTLTSTWYVAHDMPSRPLTLLVRDGKPVAS